MTTNETTDQSCHAVARTTSATLMQMLGDQLLHVALNADPRADVDDDLALMHDVAEQITAICQAITDEVRRYETRSWTYRLHRITAWLSFNSKGFKDLRTLEEIEELCQRLPRGLARAYHVARRYADDGWPGRVRDCRVNVLWTVWTHAGRCLQRGAR